MSPLLCTLDRWPRYQHRAAVKTHWNHVTKMGAGMENADPDMTTLFE